MTTVTRKILIIDDDPVITAIYQQHFKNAGFEVQIADEGQTGLNGVSEFRPDVVLLDLSMPKLSGIQWLKKVRADARFSMLPVVVLSAGASGWQMRAVRKADVTHILSKEGAVPQEVVEAVTSALTNGDWQSGKWRISDNW